MIVGDSGSQVQQVIHRTEISCMWVNQIKWDTECVTSLLPCHHHSCHPLPAVYSRGNPAHYHTINSKDVITRIRLLSESPDLFIFAVIVLWRHLCPSPLAPPPLPASLCMTFSNLTSYRLYLSLSLPGIHFRHLVVWSPLAPMSLPVTRFCVTAKGTHAWSPWQQVQPARLLLSLHSVAPHPSCSSASSLFWTATAGKETVEEWRSCWHPLSPSNLTKATGFCQTCWNYMSLRKYFQRGWAWARAAKFQIVNKMIQWQDGWWCKTMPVQHQKCRECSLIQ